MQITAPVRRTKEDEMAKKMKKPKPVKKAVKKKRRPPLDRSAIINECAAAVPTNWCDVLLTGPGAAKHPLDNRGVEQLLRGVQDRIYALKYPQ